MAACVQKLRGLGHLRCSYHQILATHRIVTRSSSQLARESKGTETDVGEMALAGPQKVAMHLEPWVAEAISNSRVTHKKHPGRLCLRTVTAPARLIDAASVLLEEYPVKEMSRKADKLANYLWSRHPPATDAQLNKMLDQTYQEILEKKEREGKPESVTRDDVLQKLRQKVYHWQPVIFDAYKSLLYLTAHLPLNYSVLLQCFSELCTRDPDFVPRSVFNLGSGLGTAVWAANTIWGSHVFEYYCVDKSQDMNTVARLLLQDGDSQKQMSIPGVVFRQFSPSASTNQFEMVVSAYTLMEHSGLKERLQTIEDLWHMTTDVLVLVENGTTAGFILINEARDHILKMAETKGDASLAGYTFSPCPHNNPCPKFRERNQPCFSQVRYRSLPQNHTKPVTCSVRYSFVVLRKGKQKGEAEWPRVIQEVVMAQNHTHCHLCCADGHVRHTVITSSRHGKDLYKCSRYTAWGDLLPVHLSADQQE